MGLLMGSNIAPLGKSSTTLIARVRSLTSVTTPVSLVIHSSQSYSTVIYTATYLQVSKLGEGELASWEVTHLRLLATRNLLSELLTYVGLVSSMGSAVDVQVGLLGKTLLAVGTVANVSLLGYLGVAWGGSGLVDWCLRGR